MKIKNYISLVLVVIGLAGMQAAAQRVTSKHARRLTAHRPNAPIDSLTATETATALDTSIATTCAETPPSQPRALSNNPQVFSPSRLASTLNGIWLGKVSGEYDPQLFAPDGYLNVDYYMIIDAQRGQGFVYQEFTSRRSGAAFTAQPGAPQWSYTWCARQDYQTKSPRQVHTFTKVSNNVDDARVLLSNSVGVTIPITQSVVLSDVWTQLVNAKFFDDPNRSLAYAGVLFNPVTMGVVSSSGGGNLLELRMSGEYRGSGQTAAKFIPGQPIYNVEMGHFLGVSSGTTSASTSGTTSASNRPSKLSSRAMATTTRTAGDYLVSSIGFGNQMVGPKQDADATVFSTQMAFDKVVLGPLNSTAPAPTVTPAAARVGPSVKGPAGNKQRR
jgi:hypothetical protein